MISTIRQIRKSWPGMHWLERVGFLAIVVGYAVLLVLWILDLTIDIPAMWIYSWAALVAVVFVAATQVGVRLRFRRIRRQMSRPKLNAGIMRWIADLPDGEFATVRRDQGRWGISIFAPGSVFLVCDVANDMDKLHATLIAQILQEIRDRHNAMVQL